MTQPGLKLPLSRDARRIPVPAAALEGWLAEIDNPGELKVTLRVVAMLALEPIRRGTPPSLALHDLLDDKALLQANELGNEVNIRIALARALRRGMIMSVRIGGEARIFVNDDLVQKYLDNMGWTVLDPADISQDNIEESEAIEYGRSVLAKGGDANIFSLYLDHLGPFDHSMAEQLRDAEEKFPMSWITDAIEQAAENRQNWNSVRVILNRWEEIRKHGKPGNDTASDSRTGYLEYYRRRYGRLPWEPVDNSGETAR